MNSSTALKIERAAKFLKTPTAKQARDYLDEPYKLALEILEAFADGQPHNFSEIAEITGLNPCTVSQVLKALMRGGFEFTITPALGWQPLPSPGRPAIALQTKKGRLRKWE